MTAREFTKAEIELQRVSKKLAAYEYFLERFEREMERFAGITSQLHFDKGYADCAKNIIWKLQTLQAQLKQVDDEK